jgi:phosphonate dehydrogenase
VLKGCDNFDVDACTEQGIWFTVVPDQLTAATAELTIGLLIGVARHVVEADEYVRREYRGWRPIFLGQGLQGSTVGILGMGAIGRAVARRLQPFDCRVLYYDEKPAQAIAEVQAAPLTSVLRESDFLIIALPLTAGTRHLINSRVIASMKPGAFLINTARGSIVDEEAVADALERKHLGGYAADVFEMEDWARPDRPRSISQRLLADRSRTVLTPHLGSAERRVRHAAEMEMAQSILDCLAGRKPRGAVNNPVTSYASVAC